MESERVMESEKDSVLLFRYSNISCNVTESLGVLNTDLINDADNVIESTNSFELYFEQESDKVIESSNDKIRFCPDPLP